MYQCVRWFCNSNILRVSFILLLTEKGKKTLVTCYDYLSNHITISQHCSVSQTVGHEQPEEKCEVEWVFFLIITREEQEQEFADAIVSI